MQQVAVRHDCESQARQIVDLLPILRRWITAKVQQAGDEGELSVRQYAALRDIREGATSPGELARHWQVTPAVLTGVIDRLERRGLVRRDIDPLDRRRYRLALTECGLTASEAIEGRLVGDLARQLAVIPEVEKAELSRSLDLLRQTFANLEATTVEGGSPLQRAEGASRPDDQPLSSQEQERAVETNNSSLLNVTP